jgi:hypothetical protein
MSKSQWHRFYQSTVAAPRELLFHLIADMPHYTRWLVLDFAMPLAVQPLRPAITSRFDQENKRTLAALKQYAETHPEETVPS